MASGAVVWLRGAQRVAGFCERRAVTELNAGQVQARTPTVAETVFYAGCIPPTQ